jgi:hypothetical protein
MCLVLGVSFGFTQALRTVGLSVHIVYLIYRFFIDDEKNLNLPSKIYHIFIDWLIILLISYLVYIFNIPYLGIDPIHHFFELIGVGSAFPSNGIETLTLGKIYLSETQPWFYLPIWILFTTPVFILALFFYSLFKFKKESRVFFLLFLALVVNLAIFYLVDPNIYNGLRHMLFLLPFMVILSVIGLWKLKNIKYFTVIVVFIVVNIILVFYSYFTLYPYQYIYFNQFAGGLKGAYGNFETDYWSASSREAAIWLKENVADKTDKMISVYSCSASQLSEYYFSPNMQIVYDKDLADYFICWERYNHFKNLQQRFAGEVIYTVDRQGVPLIYIYKKNYAQY